MKKRCTSEEEDRGSPWMLWVKDDGVGMNHESMIKMFSYGHAPPPDDQQGIGKFGAGFKTGSMACGEDAIVFTVSRAETSRAGQTCSVGLLSRSLNKGQDEILIPLVTWYR